MNLDGLIGKLVDDSLSPLGSPYAEIVGYDNEGSYDLWVLRGSKLEVIPLSSISEEGTWEVVT